MARLTKILISTLEGIIKKFPMSVPKNYGKKNSGSKGLTTEKV